MGNVTIFANAFKECGIGGRFSKFQLVQSNDWFELIDIDGLDDSRFCYKVYDRVDRRQYRPVQSTEALFLYPNDPQWKSYLQTAQKVIAKIISKGTTRTENQYFIDDLHKSVYIANRMYVIEITPVRRVVTEVASSAVYEFIDTYTQSHVVESGDLTVHTQFGKVIAGLNGRIFNSLLTPEEFNVQYGEPA